jgi:oligoendopeptidase F
VPAIAYMPRTEPVHFWKVDMSETLAASDLPVWDLSDLYPGRQSKELLDDLTSSATDAKMFQERYLGQVAALSADDFAAAIAAYEKIEEVLGRIMSYAGLCYASDMSDPKIAQFFAGLQEQVTDISSDLIFFTLEINRLDDKALDECLANSPDLSRYRPWLRDIRVMRPHQLSDDIEKLLHEKHVVGRAAWNRLFDETLANLTFEVAGQTLGLEETLNLLSEKDADKRRSAADALATTFQSNLRLFAQVTNVLAKDKEIEDKWRAFPTPDASRHLANHVEGEVVDALRVAVVDAYPRLSHRYYALKAKWLGLDQLNYWDRNAPLPEDVDRKVPWGEARDLVLRAYGRFSPEMATIGQRFFDNDWIDVPVRPGKSPGAFAHPTVPSAHPYLLLNYQGKIRDVMTLAHELGHGVHQVLAAGQGALMADTPLTLAETASVFGEQLTFRALLENEDNPANRKIMLANKVEDMINTVVRQIAFYEFEREVHAERREGELTAERLGEIWLGVQERSLGPAVKLDPDYASFWCYIPHFIHSPFYVYAYAFGDCLVNALYAVYRDADSGFQEKYFDMLRAGGTLRHKELLAPFGLDASEPSFWQQGLSVIESFIDELEAS